MKNPAKSFETKAIRHDRCPMRELLSRLGDKWSMLVIISLAKAPDTRLRFSGLMQSVTGISQRMLTTTLRHLERDGILTRHLYAEVPPRVEYTLTKRGRELLVPVERLVDWIEQQWPDIEQSRRDYDLKNGGRQNKAAAGNAPADKPAQMP